MKKWLFLVLFLALGIGAWMLFRAPTKVVPAQPQIALPDDSLKPYVNPPRLATDKSILAPTNSSASAECLQFFSDIQRLDLDKLAADLSSIRLPQGDQCKASAIEKLVTSYRKSCTHFFGNPEGASKELWAACMSSLYFLRAGISAWADGDRPLADITEVNLLADKMSVAFSATLQDPKNAQELVAISERILELDPRVAGAAKAALIGKFLQGTSRPDDPEFWQSLKPALKRAEELNPDDQQLREMELVVQTEGLNPEKTLKLAEQMVEKNRGSAQAWELMAYAHWKLNNQGLSKEAMQRALALDPGNHSLQENWQRMSEPGAGMSAFRRSTNLGLKMER